MSRNAGREKASAQRSPLRKDRSSSRGQDLHRPLLPCPQLLISSLSQIPAKQAVQTSNADLRPVRNNVTLACNECKAKKAKCDGNDPCSRCTGKGLECLFDQNRDRRRVRGLPAENAILKEKISQYERLFNTMYMTPAKEAVRVLHILRSCSVDFQQLPDCGDGLPLDELLQLVEEVQQGVTGSPDSYHGAGRSTGSLSSFNSGHLSRLNATSGISTGNTSLSPTSPVDYHLHNSKVCPFTSESLVFFLLDSTKVY